MNPLTIGRELVSAWALAVSYPLEGLAILQVSRRYRQSEDNTGHLGVLHHEKAIRIMLNELLGNRPT